MAVTCARCGTQNPDGNQFCQACGSPLAVVAEPPGVQATPPPPAAGAYSAAPPGPPPGPPAGVRPPPVPIGYQSPYYAASAVGPQPMVHRAPWLLIIGAIVGLIVVMAGCGTAIALIVHNSANQTNSTGIRPPLVPSPSPAGTPSPNQTPSSSPSPSPASTSGTTTSNAGVSFIVPPGWTVDSKDDQGIVITNPNGDGSVAIASGPSSPTQSAQQNKDTLTAIYTKQYPDTKDCPGSKTTTGSLSGAPGIFWELCFTLSSGGQSVQAEMDLFAGANSDGSVYYVVILFTSQNNMASFVSESAPVRQSIQWRL